MKIGIISLSIIIILVTNLIKGEPPAETNNGGYLPPSHFGSNSPFNGNKNSFQNALVPSSGRGLANNNRFFSSTPTPSYDSSAGNENPLQSTYGIPNSDQSNNPSGSGITFPSGNANQFGTGVSNGKVSPSSLAPFGSSSSQLSPTTYSDNRLPTNLLGEGEHGLSPPFLSDERGQIKPSSTYGTPILNGNGNNGNNFGPSFGINNNSPNFNVDTTAPSSGYGTPNFNKYQPFGTSGSDYSFGHPNPTFSGPNNQEVSTSGNENSFSPGSGTNNFGNNFSFDGRNGAPLPIYGPPSSTSLGSSNTPQSVNADNNRNPFSGNGQNSLNNNDNPDISVPSSFYNSPNPLSSPFGLSNEQSSSPNGNNNISPFSSNGQNLPIDGFDTSRPSSSYGPPGSPNNGDSSSPSVSQIRNNNNFNPFSSNIDQYSPNSGASLSPSYGPPTSPFGSASSAQVPSDGSNNFHPFSSNNQYSPGGNIDTSSPSSFYESPGASNNRSPSRFGSPASLNGPFPSNNQNSQETSSPSSVYGYPSSSSNGVPFGSPSGQFSPTGSSQFGPFSSDISGPSPVYGVPNNQLGISGSEIPGNNNVNGQPAVNGQPVVNGQPASGTSLRNPIVVGAIGNAFPESEGTNTNTINPSINNLQGFSGPGSFPPSSLYGAPGQYKGDNDIDAPFGGSSQSPLFNGDSNDLTPVSSSYRVPKRPLAGINGQTPFPISSTSSSLGDDGNQGSYPFPGSSTENPFPSSPSNNFGNPSSTTYGTPPIQSTSPASNDLFPSSDGYNQITGATATPYPGYNAASPTNSYDSSTPTGLFDNGKQNNRFNGNNQYTPGGDDSKGGNGNGNGFGNGGGGSSSSNNGDANSQPANYEFNYDVNDGIGTKFSHQETRNGDVAQGSYKVVLPDGRQQVVDYEADKAGYRPRIRYENGPDSGLNGNNRPSGINGAVPGSGINGVDGNKLNNNNVDAGENGIQQAGNIGALAGRNNGVPGAFDNAPNGVNSGIDGILPPTFGTSTYSPGGNDQQLDANFPSSPGALSDINTNGYPSSPGTGPGFSNPISGRFGEGIGDKINGYRPLPNELNNYQQGSNDGNNGFNFNGNNSPNGQPDSNNARGYPSGSVGNYGNEFLPNQNYPFNDNGGGQQDGYPGANGRPGLNSYDGLYNNFPSNPSGNGNTGTSVSNDDFGNNNNYPGGIGIGNNFQGIGSDFQPSSPGNNIRGVYPSGSDGIGDNGFSPNGNKGSLNNNFIQGKGSGLFTQEDGYRYKK